MTLLWYSGVRSPTSAPAAGGQQGFSGYGLISLERGENVSGTEGGKRGAIAGVRPLVGI
jgi:hypothetical protein